MSQSYLAGIISGTMTPLTGQVTGYVEYLVVAGGGGGGGCADTSGGGLVIGQSDPESNIAPVTISTESFRTAAAPIDENENAVHQSYTVSTNKNATSTGPIKLNKSVVFKVPKTSKWKILA